MPTWTDSLATGVPEIDEDHRRLCRLSARLIDCLRQGRGMAAVQEALHGLRATAEYHFAREAFEMSAVNYPGIEAHLRHHDDLLTRLDVLRNQEDTLAALLNDPERIKETIDLLDQVFYRHILDFDHRFVEYLRHCPCPLPAAVPAD